ncbi:MAG: HAMP domain-containing histidine kinase [Hyphomicrobiaceae bacterium]|nr:HAMP domain-containing histidine kinase [Hyphomicrobiaceae bacterium]
MTAGDGADGRELPPSPLIAAGRLLAERGVYSLIWFAPDFVVTARYGRLTEFVEVGDLLPDRCFVLIGLEGEILQLMRDPTRVIDLPAVAIVSAEEDLPRLNLTVFYDPQAQTFLMLVARATSRSDIEAELSKQMRARLIAETEVAAKSRELARTNVELARANRDLEDFAAVISHDLKAPLRALRYAAEDIGGLIEGGDLAGARTRLTEIEARTRRMSEMMTALLDYASVGRKSDIAEVVSTREIVERVVTSMPLGADFKVDIAGAWPRLETVPAALDLVLRNLIDNAVKHHDRGAGQIIVSAEPGADFLRISVIDDGPGIAPEFHEAVLLPFRSLAPPGRHDTCSTPKGTGMGLAFVNRTVETMGGKLAIHSQPSARRGTTFVLEWPCQLSEIRSPSASSTSTR